MPIQRPLAPTGPQSGDARTSPAGQRSDKSASSRDSITFSSLLALQHNHINLTLSTTVLGVVPRLLYGHHGAIINAFLSLLFIIIWLHHINITDGISHLDVPGLTLMAFGILTRVAPQGILDATEPPTSIFSWGRRQRML